MRVAFNQDASCIVCGTSRGFRIYNCTPFGKFYSSNDVDTGLQGVGAVEMFFSTSLVVVSGSAENTPENTSPRQLAILNTKKVGSQSLICELTFPTSIRTLKLNQKRLCVALDAQIYLYDISNMKLLTAIDDSLGGIIDSARTGNNWLAYAVNGRSGASVGAAKAEESDTIPDFKPSVSSTVSESDQNAVSPEISGTPPPSSSALAGSVVIYDMDSLATLAVINAHKSSVAALALNDDGSLLATSSDRGTLIRVFAVPSGTLLHEFRRGTYSSKVYSLAFNLGSRFLCVSSATQTVHVYKLDGTTAEHVSSTTSTSAPPNHHHFKKQKERWFSSSGTSRDMAYFKLPLKHNIRTTLAIPPLSNMIYAASETGKLFCYKLEESGGECKRIGEYSLD